MQYLGIFLKDPIPAYEKNSAAINLVKANKLASCLCHIDIYLAHMHSVYSQEAFNMKYYSIRFMLADFLTKALSSLSLQR